MEAALQKERDEHIELLEKIEETKNQLIHSEKMASLGQLAAGVAHEINNPVGFIMSNLGSLKEYFLLYKTLISKYEAINSHLTTVTDDKVKSIIEDIRAIRKAEDFDFVINDCEALIGESLDGTERVKDIVHQLKCFSHVDQIELKPADINACLDNTLKVVWNELKYKAEIVKEFAELPLIKCNAAELNQVFMNLLINASHAIEDRGTIKMVTEIDDDNLLVSISDTGKGIDEENLTKLFNPFFTTKSVGEGTGLGLSISHGIVEKHGGNIYVESEVGKGTTFKVVLPLNGAVRVGD